MPHAPKSQWPNQIWIARHGQSAGNVALEAAEKSQASIIEIGFRDVDVPLSELGERQAAALGDWFGEQPEAERPTIILASPYLRAERTAALVREQMKAPEVEIVFDERLREREFGIVDGLTKKGILEKYPQEAEIRSRLGKFYYRAPGGESWCDVILRLRSVMDSLARDYAGERVLIVCHTVVVMCLRYLFERMDEEQILAIDRETRLANCSLTSYRFDRYEGRNAIFALERFNFVAPLREAGEPVTRAPDAVEKR